MCLKTGSNVVLGHLSRSAAHVPPHRDCQQRNHDLCMYVRGFCFHYPINTYYGGRRGAEEGTALQGQGKSQLWLLALCDLNSGN